MEALKVNLFGNKKTSLKIFAVQFILVAKW